jgi:hypothetical protein
MGVGVVRQNLSLLNDRMRITTVLFLKTSIISHNLNFHSLLPIHSSTHPPLYSRPNSADLFAAAMTASISADRKPARSNFVTPVMVVPPGLVTRSFNWAG